MDVFQIGILLMKQRVSQQLLGYCTSNLIRHSLGKILAN